MSIETTASGQSDAGDCSPSFAAETDALYASDIPKWDDDDYVPVPVYLRMRDHARELERQRNKAKSGHSSCCGVRDHWKAEALELRKWVMEAAPMLSKAACIVVDECPARLGEIAGVRATLETCPVDFPENAQHTH